MTITAASRLYSDNLRRLRRHLNGRGVNIRETIVVGEVYAGDRIVVPGLHDDDAIVSVLNMTDLVDATGYLDVGGEAATADVFATNKGVRFTARRAGEDGNKIAVKAAADPDESAPLSVVVGQYDTVFGTSGNPGKTGILVNLATDSDGNALTSSANSAANVRAAVLQNQDAAKLVEAELLGTGATAWTATGPTALSGGASFRKGPSTAVLDVDGPYDEDAVRYAARRAGAEGNDISVEHVAGGALAVAVATKKVTVTYVVGETTVQEAVDAVNADADASALVVASVGPGGDPDSLLSAKSETNLSGGEDPGIALTEASGGKKLKVTWLTRDERDEN